MSDATTMLKELAEPWRPGEFVKDVLERIAPLHGLKASRAFEIWYGRARRVEDHEIEKIAAALAKKNRGAVWREITELKNRLARLETIVAGSNEEFGQPTISGAGPRLHLAGGGNRTSRGR